MDCLGPNANSQFRKVKKSLKIVSVLVLLLLLLLVRAFEDSLFYDPLLEYFKGDYKTLPLPEMDMVQLLLGVVFRSLLNTIISLLIIWIVFWDKEILKLSLVLYGLLFMVLFAAFAFIVYTANGGSDQFLLFYVRRFLIQPLFLLILLPAFYFQKFKFR